MNNLRKRFPFYSKLLGLYPSDYRREYASEILQTTADMLDDAGSWFKRLTIWSRVAVDLPINITRQQFNYATSDMTSGTPKYIKHTGVVSGILLLPFVVSLIVNAVDKTINSPNLRSFLIFSRPAFSLWLVDLPLLAVILVIASYIRYVVARPIKSRPKTWTARAADLRHLWPVIIPGFIALAIVLLVRFHDSSQCFMHNPVSLAGHINRTWQCTLKNRSF